MAPRLRGSAAPTAGRKLTPGVDPEGDTAVALRQVRSLEAVLVLEAAVRRLLRRRAAGDDVGQAPVENQRREES